MPKDTTDKKSKKERSKSEAAQLPVDGMLVDPQAKHDGDVDMNEAENVEIVIKDKKDKKKKDKESIVVVPLAEPKLSPIAHPLASDKLAKKVLKTVKKASRQRQVKRGVKEVQKGMRKGDQGLLVIAADISPIDILSHLPVLAEDCTIPYVFVTSKEELGLASSTKRATSCVLVVPSMKRKKPKVVEGKPAKEEKEEDYSELFDETVKDVKALLGKEIIAPRPHRTPASLASQITKEPSGAPNMPAPKTAAKDKPTTGTVTKDAKKKGEKTADAPKAIAASATEPLKLKSGADIPVTVAVAVAAGGRPDQVAYNKEQDELKKEIDELNKKLSVVKDKIAGATKPGPGDERRKQLKAEMDEIRAQQGDGKSSRENILTDLKAMNESVAQKIKELQAANAKLQYKSVAELEAHIKELDARVESGNLKLVDEKRALQDISTAKRQRRVIEGYQAQKEAIDEEKTRADELRKQLDDPELKAVSERYDAIKTELDVLKKEDDASYASRNILFDERSELQAKLDAFWSQKKAAASAYREAQDLYWTKMQEDRARKAEKARETRQAIEDEKKQEVIERLREEGSAPAYQSQIEDCQTLIDQLSGTASTSVTGFHSGREQAVVPELDLRKVDDAIDKNLVAVKKKGEEMNYFVATKKPKAAKKGGKPNGTTPPESTSAVPAVSDKLKISLATLAALATLSIPPPATPADVPQTIENLKIKKEWYLANQEKQTVVNKAKAEKDIESLLRSMSSHTNANGHDAAAMNGSAEASHHESPKAAAAEVET
ncbi:hypothetical protein FRB96_000016 [Tulasnella sp. 330]|nr:hypothetical protein FRB96_000016 [Tulasnella sp. 330]